MRIGIPAELPDLETRVALVPAACAELAGAGHEVIVEHGAGSASGHSDRQYIEARATIASSRADLYAAAELIVKVRAPGAEELGHLGAHQVLVCHLHAAVPPDLTGALRDLGMTVIACELVEDASGSFPVVAPSSEIAGRVGVQIGAQILQGPTGKSLLLGGVAGARRGRVVVLGAGVAGRSGVRLAAALGADVTVYDTDRRRLLEIEALGANVTVAYPYAREVATAVRGADLLVGAVLVAGARAPYVVTEDMVASMERGSVVVDLTIEQGGCIATSRATTLQAPTFDVCGVIHVGVPNLPAVVPYTSSQALSAALVPWLLRLAEPDWRTDALLAGAVVIDAGRIVHPALIY
jgi:alanine dehydrogenase